MAAAESAVAQRSTLEQRSSRIAGLDSFTYGSASSREVAKCSGASGTGQEHLLDSVSDNGLSRCLVNQQRWGGYSASNIGPRGRGMWGGALRVRMLSLLEATKIVLCR